IGDGLDRCHDHRMVVIGAIRHDDADIGGVDHVADLLDGLIDDLLPVRDHQGALPGLLDHIGKHERLPCSGSGREGGATHTATVCGVYGIDLLTLVWIERHHQDASRSPTGPSTVLSNASRSSSDVPTRSM